MAARSQDGFTLIEALIALAILSMVLLGFLGVRTDSMIDAEEARNWRLAREIAEQQMSELQAGAREVAPDSGHELPVEKYAGFYVTILIGEQHISDYESRMAGDADSYDADSRATDRLAWQRERDDYRMARQKGMSVYEFREQRLQENLEEEDEDQIPSETELEDVMVAVRFPQRRLAEERLPDPVFKIKAKVSTMAIQGYTPEEAQSIAEARGGSAGSSSASAGANLGGSSSNESSR